MKIKVVLNNGEYFMFDTQLEHFLTTLKENAIFWNQNQGTWINSKEIAYILFTKEDQNTQATTPQPTQENAPESEKTMSPGCNGC